MRGATVLFRCETAVLYSSSILRHGIQRLQSPTPPAPRNALTPLSFARPLTSYTLRCLSGTTSDLPSSAAPGQLPLLPKPPTSLTDAPAFAFAFDIDGVLLHSRIPYPPAIPTLHHLQRYSIPFILLTNGGGTTEQARAISLSRSLLLPLSERNIIQSHTPFCLIASQGKLPPSYDPYVPGGRELTNSVLVVGGPMDASCRGVAEQYGFKNVVIPEDIMVEWAAAKEVERSSVWPYHPVSDKMRNFTKPLPRLASGEVMPIDAILVFHDPRDWGMNIQILLDLMIPRLGGVDTAGNPPPPLIFSNPDLLFATAHPTPRLGQGAFRAALEGTYRQVVEATRPDLDPQMKYVCIGKPYQETYEYTEDQLVKQLAGKETVGAGGQLKRVYMVGDNPLSDIQGANRFKSPRGVEWVSVLVESGVYKPGQLFPPGGEPKIVVKDVWKGVKWVLEREGWKE
ncbi:HAD-superfamily subfamily IIA hydrolase [Tirmania nivea]|nr:HAD-superfamily subfamily IIA hydrolase [Tirmania nivea]